MSIGFHILQRRLPQKISKLLSTRFIAPDTIAGAFLNSPFLGERFVVAWRNCFFTKRSVNLIGGKESTMKRFFVAIVSTVALAAVTQGAWGQGLGSAPGGQRERPSYNQTRKTLPLPSIPTPGWSLLPKMPDTAATPLGQITDGAGEIISGAIDLVTPWRNNRVETLSAPTAPTGTRRRYAAGAGSSASERNKTFGSSLLSIFQTEQERTGNTSQVNGFLNQPRVGR